MRIKNDKKDVLLELINKLEEGIGDLSTKLELNKDIKDLDWKIYEKDIFKLYSILKDLEEEVEFS